MFLVWPAGLGGHLYNPSPRKTHSCWERVVLVKTQWINKQSCPAWGRARKEFQEEDQRLGGAWPCVQLRWPQWVGGGEGSVKIPEVKYCSWNPPHPDFWGKKMTLVIWRRWRKGEPIQRNHGRGWCNYWYWIFENTLFKKNDILSNSLQENWVLATRKSQSQWLAGKPGRAGCVALLQTVDKRGQVCPATRERGILTKSMWTGGSKVIPDRGLDLYQPCLKNTNHCKYFQAKETGSQANRGGGGNLEIRSVLLLPFRSEHVTNAQRLGLACGI